MRYLIAAAAALGLAGSAMAETWTVDDDGPADFDNIQAAVDAASDGDEIVVEAGTYTSTQDGHVIDMLGKAITLRSSQGADVTIIDGEGARRGIACFSGETAKTVIEGFTITNGLNVGYDYGGDGDINFPDNSGGGIYCYSDSNPTLSGCTISDNTGGLAGGGIFCIESSPTLSGCTISNNTASYGGGGCACWHSGNLTLTDCTITGNTANNGGGIYCDNSSPAITGCTISGNTANSGGGGINCWSSNPTLAYTTVCGNTPDQIDGEWIDGGRNTIADECPDCPDINGDGEVGVDEILAVIAAWDTDDADADVNGDGIVDTNDILLVLSAWGPCP